MGGDHRAGRLGNVLWIVDYNRQSLDRAVPVARARQHEALFASAGWHVCEVRYGQKLRERFAQPHGEALRDWFDTLPDAEHRAMSRLTGAALRSRVREHAPARLAVDVERALADVPDAHLAPLLQNFGGHDPAALLAAYAECDAVLDRPSVVFAHTVKGWGLPTAWDQGSHYTLLVAEQINELRASVGLSDDDEWDRFPEESDAGRWCRARSAHLIRPAPDSRPAPAVPAQAHRPDQVDDPAAPCSTQQGFGRILTHLADDPDVVPYLVTTAPDVATGTGLSGFVDRMRCYRPAGRRDPDAVDPMLGRRATARGQHLELGISEMNLFLLLGQLGLSWDLSDQPLLPIGTVYDPFLCRGLDGLIYAAYSGARFVVVGTPSGVSLAPEGGEHQSTITPSIGLELSGVTYCEPAYVGALDWLLCDALARIARGTDQAATYLRLSSRPLDQAPFAAARQRHGEEELRRLVLAGGYRLVDASAVDGPPVHLIACGAVLPEVLAAAHRLADRGVAAHVVDLTSPGRVYAAWQLGLRESACAGTSPQPPGLLDELFPVRAPVVTVHDASSHALAWLGSALGVPAVPLGVDGFGQSGSVRELYELHDLMPDAITGAADVALGLAS